MNAFWGDILNEEEKIRAVTGTEVADGLCIRNIRSSSAKRDIQNWLSKVMK